MDHQTHCFVVNLATDRRRRLAMEQTLQLAGVQAEFFSAVDGRSPLGSLSAARVGKTMGAYA